MSSIKFIIFLVFTMFSSSLVLSNELFSGFDVCELSKKALQARGKIIQYEKPTEKLSMVDHYWEYEYQGGIMGLPTKKVMFGICFVDKPLSRSCGVSSFINFSIDMKFKDAKKVLLESYGIDFSKEERIYALDDDMGTARPVLFDSDGETSIFCDNGSL